MPFCLLRERNEERESAEADKLMQMRAMRDEGMTYQQIADALGYKSHASVARALKL